MEYKIDSHVKYTHTDNVERHYIRVTADVAGTGNPTPEADANWTRETKEDVLGTSTKYSPWTDNMASEWQNSGSAMDNPASGNFDKRGC